MVDRKNINYIARGWHPIETAPKDGTVVWLINENDGRPDTGYVDSSGQWRRARGNGEATHWRPRSKDRMLMDLYYNDMTGRYRATCEKLGLCVDADTEKEAFDLMMDELKVLLDDNFYLNQIDTI